MRSASHRCLLIPQCLVMLALALGCHHRSSDSTPNNASAGTKAQDRSNTAGLATGTDQAPDDYLQAAMERLDAGDLDAAATFARKALVRDPESMDASLIAAKVEAARGKHQAAANLASSIDVQSRLGEQAVEVHYQQLVKLNRYSAAADVILAALKVVPEAHRWRHQAWRLLCRVGRRQEASAQADLLCRAGLESEQERLSLLRRDESFPFALIDGEKPEQYFEPGLGMARWYFTQQEYRRALEELSIEFETGFRTSASCALYGRLLAETQAFEELGPWRERCDQDVSNHCDYWAALGTYFFDQHQYEASARALLEAVLRDPTDDFSTHRLAKVFDALDRPDNAAQFRRRAIVIAQTDRDAVTLFKTPSDHAVRKNLTRKILELGRPFEALQWSLSSLPATATKQRAIIEKQRADLSRNPTAVAMAAETALVGIDRQQFQLETALESLPLKSPEKAEPSDATVDLDARPRLVNVAGDVGLAFQWYQDLEINTASIPMHEMMGGGIAVIDFDLDGWPDLYLAQGSGDPPTDACTRSNALFRNVAARFQEVTPWAQAEDFHYSTGLTAGDVNQDGFTDLLIGNLGRNRLLVNNGDGTFRDATEQLGVIENRFTTSLAIADINGDALPDLFEAIYIEMEGAFKLPDLGPDGREIPPMPLTFYANSDRWFENRGDGRFTGREITADVAAPATSLGVVVTDLDSNGSNEVFLANDARPNHLLVYSGDNQFHNVADARGVASGFSGEANGCMGIATGDFNRDGTCDLHITNYVDESSNQYLQTSAGGFTDSATRYGIDRISRPFVGFGTKAIDIDRNGWLDLIVTNGHVFDQRHRGEPFHMPPQLLMNRGRTFDLANVEDESGYWNHDHLGRAMALTDYDRDGAIDILVGHFDKPLALLRNETRTGGVWIQFELVGTTSERDAIGARIVLTMGNERMTTWVTAGDGYLCSDEAVIEMGLGLSRGVDQAEVFWPSGRQQTIQHPELRLRHLVVEGQQGAYPR